MSGAVLHSLNTRLDAATIAFQLDHAEAKILIVDIALLLRVREALALAKGNSQLIIYDDAEFDGPRSAMMTEYETFIASGDADFAWKMPDENGMQLPSITHQAQRAIKGRNITVVPICWRREMR